MAESISAFFQSLLPDSRPRSTPAPTRLTTETRTVGSSPAPQTKGANSTATSAATAARSATGSLAEGGSVPSKAAPAGNEEEIRKRREQFLNGLSSGKGKGLKKGNGVGSSA